MARCEETREEKIARVGFGAMVRKEGSSTSGFLVSGREGSRDEDEEEKGGSDRRVMFVLVCVRPVAVTTLAPVCDVMPRCRSRS